MNNKLLRGSLDTIILQLLAQEGEMYGYAISQRVKEKTDGEVQLTEGALYPSLHRLESKGWLKAVVRYEDNRHRKYYHINDQGRGALRRLLKDMKSYIGSMNALLNLSLS